MTALMRRYLRPYHRALLGVVVLLAVQTMGILYLPTVNADIIDEGVVVGDIDFIVSRGSLMLAVSVLVAVVSIMATYLAARTAMGFGRDVRRAIYGSVQGFSRAEMNRFGAPTLITRNTNDVQQVQMLVLTGQTMIVSAPLMAVGGVYMSLRQNVQLSTLLVVIVPIMFVLIVAILRPAVPLFRSVQVRLDGINDVLRQNLEGIRVIRAFVKTDHEEARFDEANVALSDVTLRVTRLFALMMPLLMLVFNLSSVAVIWFGGHLVADGQMQIGDLTAFLSYIMQILFSVMMAVMLLMMIPRAVASAERITAVLQTEPAITDPVTPMARAPGQRGVVEFEDVEFRYPGAEEPVLSGINLTMRPGQTTAIVGGTGSGKTTLINLIPRLFDVTSGSVRLSGVDVREQDREVLRAQLGFVPQRAFLFAGSVGSNIRLGSPGADDETVWQALVTAQAHGFVSDLAEGLGAPIEQGGANVSGGQRQRLAIARALVRRPDILVFDDSFSALDFSTDARLRTALRQETGEATVVMVAQRVSTIRGADQVVVLERGEIRGVGTHEELMDTSETYREIVLSQLTEDEAR